MMIPLIAHAVRGIIVVRGLTAMLLCPECRSGALIGAQRACVRARPPFFDFCLHLFTCSG